MTRLYFSSSTNADVAVPINGIWNAESVEIPKVLNKIKLGSSPIIFATAFSPGQTAAHIRFVSPPLSAQTLAGTVKCQVSTYELSHDDNITSRLEIYIIGADGTIRGTLLSINQYGPATEYSITPQNKTFADGDSVTSVDVLEGDRIVAVLGHINSSAAVVRASLQILDLGGFADLGENETDADVRNPWIEFSQDIQWLEEGTGVPPSTGSEEDDPLTEPTDYPSDVEEPKIPPPPPWYPLQFTNDNPGGQIPHEGIEEYIYLVKVEGNPTEGFVFRDHRVLSLDYKSLDWWYHRTGGCGSFRLLSKEQRIISDVANDRAWQWELHVRIRLPGESSLRTWYRGIINSATAEQCPSELLVDVRGIGYEHLLNRIWVSRKYPPNTPISTVLADLIDVYIVPNTPIRRAEAIDVTEGGLDQPEYLLRGGINLECSVFKALKLIAELEGNIEWGIDANRNFYWRRQNEAGGLGFFLDKDTTYIRGGHYSAERINKVRMSAFPLGSEEYKLTRNDITDITDITSKGEHNIIAEVPWFLHPSDAAHWADNIIVARRRLLHWRIVGWKEVSSQIERNHPLLGIPMGLWRDGNDVTTGFSPYHIDKIHYFKGGIRHPKEVREKGRTQGHELLGIAQLRAEVYLGNPPKEQGEVLESISDQIEGLKSRNRIRRYPRDVTDITNQRRYLDVTGNIPGEIIHVSRDITNYNVLNSPLELQDSDNPRGFLLAWLAKQWEILSTRMLVMSLPARGRYVGQIVSLITDYTNPDGDLYWWNGSSWAMVGSGATGGGLLSFGGNVGVSTANSMTPFAISTAAALGVDAFSARVEATRSATLRNLRMRSGIPITVTAVTFTIRVNGVNTSLSATIDVGNSEGVDTTNTVSLSPGDLVELTISSAGTANRPTYGAVSFD